METRNSPIIADSSALVALINPSDSLHAAAVHQATGLLSTHQTIVLPGEVLTETLNLLGKKFGHAPAVAAGHKFLRDKDSLFLVVETGLAQLQAALDLFAREK